MEAYQNEKEVIVFAARLFKAGVMRDVVMDLTSKAFNISGEFLDKGVSHARNIYRSDASDVAPPSIRLDRLGPDERALLDIFTEGEGARQMNLVNPYRGGTLAHCLHAAGWVSRDLQLALEKVSDGVYVARPISSMIGSVAKSASDNLGLEKTSLPPVDKEAEKLKMAHDKFNQSLEHLQKLTEVLTRPMAGGFNAEQILNELKVVRLPEPPKMLKLKDLDLVDEEDWDDLLDKDLVEKVKGYPFPGVVLTEFTTRRGKRRVIVEGVGNGNEQCLHIFSPDDLRPLEIAYGWVFRYGDEWQHSWEYPDNADAFTCRPATEAEGIFASALSAG